MKRRTRRNPPIDVAMASIAPFLPYAVGGVLIYFYGEKIWALLAAKLTGKSYAQVQADVKTVSNSLSHPLTTAREISNLIDVKTGVVKIATKADYERAIVDIQKKTGVLTGGIRLPFPTPKSQAEFRSNIDAINKAKGWGAYKK